MIMIILFIYVGTSAPSTPWNTSNLSQRLSTSDASGYSIYVRAIGRNGSTYYSVPGDTTDGFTFEFSDSSTLIVGQEGELYPVKAGSVNVIVKYDGAVVAAVPVTIIGNRVTVSLDVELSKTTLSSGADADDSLMVTVTAKDQLGASTVTSSNVGLEPIGVNLGPTQNQIEQSGDGKFVFKNTDFSGVTSATTYQYRVTVGGLARTFSFVVNQPSTYDESQANAQVVLSTNSVDLAFDMSKALGEYDFTVEFGVALYAPNGYKIKNVEADRIMANEAAAKTAAEGNRGTIYYYFTTTNLNNASLTGAAIQLYDNKAVSGGAITKASAGTMRVYLHSAVAGETGPAATRTVHNALLTVADSQSGPSVTVKTNRLVSQVFTGDAISSDVFDVKLNNTDVSSRVVIGDVVGSNTNNPFIRNLKMTIDVLVDGVTYTYTYSIPVNQSFIVQN